jgi:hypothetical protein
MVEGTGMIESLYWIQSVMVFALCVRGNVDASCGGLPFLPEVGLMEVRQSFFEKVGLRPYILGRAAHIVIQKKTPATRGLCGRM